MTKTYCDLCGKEIESPAITLTIDLHEEEEKGGKGMIVIPPVLTSASGWKDFDICEDCKDRAIDFFKPKQEDYPEVQIERGREVDVEYE